MGKNASIKDRVNSYPLLVVAVSQIYADHLNRSKNRVSYEGVAPETISLGALKAHLRAGFDPDSSNTGLAFWKKSPTLLTHMLSEAGASLDKISLLVKAGAGVNHRDGLGHSPLDVACAAGAMANVSHIRFLIQHGADINAVDAKGESALSRMMVAGHDHIAKMMAQEAADFRERALNEKLNKALATRVKKYVQLNITDRVTKYLNDTKQFAKDAKQGILDRMNAVKDGAILVATNVRNDVQGKIGDAKQAAVDVKQAAEQGRDKALERLGSHTVSALGFVAKLRDRAAQKAEQIKDSAQKVFTAIAATPMTVANAMSASINQINTVRREDNDRLAYAFVTKVLGNPAPLSGHFLSEVLDRGMDPNTKVSVKQSESDEAREMTLLEYAVLHHLQNNVKSANAGWAGGEEIIDRLIQAGADIHATNAKGATLVERAFANDAKLGERILAAYNDVKAKNPTINRGALTF